MPGYKHNWAEKNLRKIVSNCTSIAQVLRKMDIQANGGNYTTFRKYTDKYGIDTSHFKGQGHLKGKTHDWNKKIPLDEILVANSTYTNRSRLKDRLLRKKRLSYECKNCGIKDWQNKPISLHLDHINGINDDHRLENLRLLCPNCHSQTDTFGGKNKGTYE